MHLKVGPSKEFLQSSKTCQKYVLEYCFKIVLYTYVALPALRQQTDQCHSHLHKSASVDLTKIN